MNCCKSCSIPIDENTKIIDKSLQQELVDQQSHIKLLLLGTGESGKSTILKQVKILKAEGFSVEELSKFKTAVYSDIVSCAKSLVTAVEHFGIKYGEGDDIITAISVLSEINGSITEFTEEQSKALSTIFNHPVFIGIAARRNKFQISDSVDHIMKNISRFLQSDFIPNQEDVVRIRIRTIGIRELTFQQNNNIVFHFLDVGGQRSERRKWLHAFDNVKTIIFVASLSEYDQTLMEDEKTNRMQESLEVFKTILNYPAFDKISFLLFLNKVDLFKDKIMYSPLNSFFPEFTGNTKNYEECISFITSKYVALNQKENRSIYHHVTCATDTDQIGKVINTVTDSIVEENLTRAGVV